jgi:type VI secretion system protein ImpH
MEAVASDDRLPATAVSAPVTEPAIERLVANPAGFDLFQAIGMLERAVPGAQPLGRGNGAGEAVRLRGMVSLAFQPRDIGAVRREGPEGEGGDVAAPSAPAPYTLTTPAMSLAGATGPLPLAYTEMLLERRAARDHAMGDLLDIFNHRFLSFLYRGRRKHAPALGGQEPTASTLAACLDALGNLGLSPTVHRAGTPREGLPWLRHAGLLGGAPRSMAALLALLSDRLGMRIGGSQFVGGWLAVDDRDAVRLSARARPAAIGLGAGTVLGRRAWDQAAGIRLDVPVPAAGRMAALLPGGADHGLIARLVNAHAAQRLDVELALHVDAPEPARLGAGARLGWTSWLAGACADAHPGKPVRLALRAAGDAVARTGAFSSSFSLS